MSNFITVLSAVSAIIATAPAGLQNGRSRECDGADRSSCRYIFDATEAFTKMLVTADPAPLQRHLDPRALWILSDGQVRSGLQLIDTVRRDTRRATARLDHAHVRLFANVAIVTWRESWTAPDATVKVGQLAGVDTWFRHGRTWKVLSTVETRLNP